MNDGLRRKISYFRDDDFRRQRKDVSMARHVLVTGGAGYVGSHACKALASAGYTPIAYDNLVHGHEWAVRWGPLEKGDILDKVRLDEVLGKYRPEAVMHFAAFAYVGESVGNPGKYYRNNLCGTVTLLESMRDHEVDRIVFSSSCSTYGAPESLPIKETHPQKRVNTYRASKRMVERILEDFDAAHGIKRSEEHTSELQSPCNLVCRLLLEKKNKLRPVKFALDSNIS